MRILLATCFLLVFGGACKKSDLLGDAQGFASLEGYDKAYAYSEGHAGKSLLIYKGDQLVYERYASGITATSAHEIFSGTKSFNCAMAVAAQSDGLIDLDDWVSDTLTEWAGDSQKSQIKIRHLLQFVDGLQQQDSAFLLYTGNRYSFGLAASAVADTNTQFEYGEIHHAVWGELMRRKLVAAATGDANPYAYLKRKVFDPIGLEVSGVTYDSASNPMLSYGMELTPRNWLKYGQLIVQSGSWDGSQILDSTLLSQCFTGSSVFAGYGINFWLNAPMPSQFSGVTVGLSPTKAFPDGGPGGMIYQNAPSDLVAATGTGGSRMYIIPSQSLIIVRTAAAASLDNYNDAHMLSLILGQ